MEKYVIVYGGNSPENEISVITALKVYEEMKNKGNEPYLVYIDINSNFYGGKNLQNNKNYINKRSFKKASFFKKKNKSYLKVGCKKYIFDYAYILGHGICSEDGTISSYFEMLNIPYLYDDIYNVSLLQDKEKSKKIFNSFNIKTIKSEVIYRYQFNDIKVKNIKLKYPLIVKPNHLGSSIGVSLINKEKDLKNGIFDGLKYDETVLVEECIKNKIEYNIALVGYQNKVLVSSIEKVNDEEKVLDFFDKYDYSNKNKKRVIDPPLDDKLKNEIIKQAKCIFTKMNLCGVYRFDFIYSIDTEEIFLNEVNVLPGSLAYYLFESKNINFIDLIIMDISLKTKKYNERNNRLKEYEPNYINNIDISKLVK